MTRRLKYVVMALLVGAVIAALALLPVRDWLLAIVTWVRGAGAAGMMVYGIAYVVAGLLLLPGSLLTLGAGFAYGPWVGILLASPISVLAASLSFALGRSLARGWVSRKIAGDARFRSIDRAIGERRFRIVLLLRLSPVIPFNLLNYALGLTRVRFRDYVLASWLGMLPGTVLYVYMGSLVTSASELLSGKSGDAATWQVILYWGGLLATAAVTILLARIARRALAGALHETGGFESGEESEVRG